MDLIEAAGSGRVSLDTVAFIYFIEEHPKYLPLLRPLFSQVDRGEREVVTSAVTLLEVLVVPYRAGDIRLAERYEVLLTRSRGVTMVDLHRGLLRRAAQLRADHGVRAPDALQLAAGMETGCTTFVTNDRRLPEISGIRVIQLDGLS